MPTADGHREIFIEFIVHGNLIKTNAVDAATGIEVSIFAPASTPRDVLKQTAAAKLRYVLNKKADGK